MIAAAVDCLRPDGEEPLFRGRPVRFWLAQFFPFCRFSDLPRREDDFSAILVFDASVFPVGAPDSFYELRKRLRARDHSAPWLVAPAGEPFFIASSAFLKKWRIRLRPGVFGRLRAAKKAVTLAMDRPFAACRIDVQPRRIENAVIDLQINRLREKNVHVEDYGRFFMDGLVAVGKNTRIGSGVTLRGASRIGKNVVLFPNCYIENSRIGDGCVILPGSVICDSIVEKNAQLGPYCHVRGGSLVRDGAKIGNFVEMKKSRIGPGSKAMHLSYIGDAQVGRKVNVGAGTITCNYDGEKKNPTVIGDNVFIGSGTELVAPVAIHANAWVAAGSTITEDVPPNALAVARQRQRVIPGWVARKKKKTE
jgi:bifunctional UDP-N-acetylglucosamine pyrophosphorylase/glucosamine-1-phosphate N-acetyltransferase